MTELVGPGSQNNVVGARAGVICDVAETLVGPHEVIAMKRATPLCASSNVEKLNGTALDTLLVAAAVTGTPLLLTGLEEFQQQRATPSAIELPVRFKHPVESAGSENGGVGGARMHGDHGQTWLYLQSGRKRWYFTRHGERAMTSDRRVTQAVLLEEEPNILCTIVQDPGQLMYLPERIMHATYNEAAVPTLGVSVFDTEYYGDDQSPIVPVRSWLEQGGMHELRWDGAPSDSDSTDQPPAPAAPSAVCKRWCSSPCSDLNGDSRHECGACSSSHACWPGADGFAGGAQGSAALNGGAVDEAGGSSSWSSSCGGCTGPACVCSGSNSNRNFGGEG